MGLKIVKAMKYDWFKIADQKIQVAHLTCSAWEKASHLIVVDGFVTIVLIERVLAYETVLGVCKIYFITYGHFQRFYRLAVVASEFR